MRGGPFSETRVIELINRRFVPFYFNTGGPGLGKDEAAAAFVLGKVPNRWAFFAAFSPDGEILSQTETYAGTEDVVAWLNSLLQQWPEFAAPTAEEENVLARAAAGGDASVRDATALLAAARVHEELLRFTDSAALYAEVAKGGSTAAVEGWRGWLRSLRHQRQWTQHDAVARDAKASPCANLLETDLAIEAGYRLLAAHRPRSARRVVQAATRTEAAAGSLRLAEAHFVAGLACWFDGARDWAKLHWCWIVEHRPEDRFFQRASVAAAAEVMPYPNQELGGFEAKAGPVGPGIVQTGVRKARTDYERLLPLFDAGELGLPAPRASAHADADADADADAKAAAEMTAMAAAAAARARGSPLQTPDALIVRLRDDATGDVAAATARVQAELVRAGEPALAPVFTAAANPAFVGRRMAAATIVELLRAVPDRPTWLGQSLASLARDGDAQVAASARQALELAR